MVYNEGMDGGPIEIQAIFSIISRVWIRQSPVTMWQTAPPQCATSHASPTAQGITLIHVGTDVACFTGSIRRDHDRFLIK